MEKKLKKFNLVLYILVLACIFAMVVIMAKAYFAKVNKNKDVEVKENTINMLISFNENNQINIHNIKNNYSEEREFTIDNYSSDTIGKYKIVLEVITPLSNMVDENFVYSIVGETENKDKTNKLISVENIPIPVITKELTGGIITPNATHKYKLTVKMQNSKIKYPKDNLFSLKIKVLYED